MSTHPWVIEVYTSEMSDSIKLRLEDELILGRHVPGEKQPPDIDLSPYQADHKGVSRHHAVIYEENGILMLSDLNSANGTILNGEPLKPDVGYRLSNSNSVVLGHMELELSIAVASAAADDKLQTRTAPTLTGHGELVLIVEDDPEVANVLSLLLERGGFKTKIAYEVVRAIQIFNKQKPHAILLDLMLPDMNGLELCRYVRRDAERNNIPVIVVSADRNAISMEDALDAGADIYLNKPVNGNELREVVTELIIERGFGHATIETRELVGTAPLQGMEPQARKQSIVLYIAGHSEIPMILDVPGTTSFGRTASTASLDSHIDLTDYNAIDKGVSRLHMFIHQRGGRFYVEDAGSTNGTYLNGDRLPANEMVMLKNSDDLRLGSLSIFVYFLGTDENQSSEADSA